jgi:hypothetical protein
MQFFSSETDMELNLDWQRRQSALWPEVSYELRPLRVWAFQELLAFWEAAPGGASGATRPHPPNAPAPHAGQGGVSAADADGLNPSLLSGEGSSGASRAGEESRATVPGARSLAATAGLMAVARRILPEHVRDLRGLTARTEAGSGPVAVADLCEEALLLPLAAELVARLIERSTLDGADAKN